MRDEMGCESAGVEPVRYEELCTVSRYIYHPLYHKRPNTMARAQREEEYIVVVPNNTIVSRS